MNFFERRSLRYHRRDILVRLFSLPQRGVFANEPSPPVDHARSIQRECHRPNTFPALRVRSRDRRSKSNERNATSMLRSRTCMPPIYPILKFWFRTNAETDRRGAGPVPSFRMARALHWPYSRMAPFYPSISLPSARRCADLERTGEKPRGPLTRIGDRAPDKAVRVPEQEWGDHPRPAQTPLAAAGGLTDSAGRGSARRRPRSTAVPARLTRPVCAGSGSRVAHNAAQSGRKRLYPGNKRGEYGNGSRAASSLGEAKLGEWRGPKHRKSSRPTS